MANLREIWLENNNLDQFPPVLLTVRTLRRIWLDHNQIREVIFFCFFELFEIFEMFFKNFRIF